MHKLLIFILLAGIFLPSLSSADAMIGGETVYYVIKGDTLEKIGAKLGVNWRDLVRENSLDMGKPLAIGQEIRANTKKIIPKATDDGIIINIPDRMLYFFREGKLKYAFPVGLGKPTWQTPTGTFHVSAKQKNPTWYVPGSIQREMEKKGETVKKIVPPCPENPLGRYAVKLSIPYILIHETIWPTSVYQFRSHGCVRVLPQDMERFFQEVVMNITVEIVYNPVKIAVSDSGKVFLEVHRDVYGKVKDLNGEAKRLIDGKGVSDKVNWQRVDDVIKEKKGIAEDITL